MSNSPAVKIYGQTHSPWVQAVLLGATEKNLDYQLVTATPFAVLRRWGVMMPAARFGDDDWILESAVILEQMGYSKLEDGIMQKIQGAWRGVFHRTDNTWRFLREFSLAGDPSPGIIRRSLQNYFRSFSSFYFYLLISTMVRVVKPKDPDDFGTQFLFWEQRLRRKGAEFFGGDSPDSEDFLLLGIIQCHCSVPVPPLGKIRHDERLTELRDWVDRMQNRLDHYPYHYSARYIGNQILAAKPASLWDQGCFWMGLATWTLAFPITIPLVYLLRQRVPT